MTQQRPEDSVLGKPVAYIGRYAPELLFPIPRAHKRQEIGIDLQALPFFGIDSWNAYELSWLNPKGKPIVAVGEFRVPADTPNIIESKSLKLYLNSYNQTSFESVEQVTHQISSDLTKSAGGNVSVCIQPLDTNSHRNIGVPPGVCLDMLDIEIEQYTPNPNLLSADHGQQVKDELLYSHLLKSNCLVTGQPDWGMLAIRYSGPAINREALLRYIISFREHNEFHEQCVERIFMDISRHCAPGSLEVWARYTRRGGLDINPYRSSSATTLAPTIYEVRQ